MGTLTEHWPLLGLRLTTPRLELRLPAADELAALADLAAEGVHDPAAMPFLVPWTDLPPAERARSVVQYYWRQQGSCVPENWSLPLTVFAEGRVVGQQSLDARDFAVLREVSSGSWLGLRYQGQGIGREMRAAVLHLGFAGLGARAAVSGCLEGSDASLAVSLGHGYQRDGLAYHVIRGRTVAEQRLRLGRAEWERRRRVPVTITGLEPCLPLLGL